MKPDRSIGELVTERPARAHLFERLHIDYCCGGAQTLAEACAQAGLQVETVQAALETIDELRSGESDEAAADWREVPTVELCEHIVTAHHDFLRQAFPKIDSLAATVIRVHGGQDSALTAVQRLYQEVRDALAPHLDSEETELFPSIIAAERGGPSVAEEILAGHEYEHRVVGKALVDLRSACRGYDHRFARCNTHRGLLDALQELESDLHQHIHEENNVLFARARRAQPATASSEDPASTELGPTSRQEPTLAACCRGWVAEQGERWARDRRR